jgi:5'-nucleotidase
MESKRARRATRVVGLALAALALAVPSAMAASKPVDVQLLGINDFHGQLEPGTGSSGRIGTTATNVPAGGAEYLATHIRALEKGKRNSLVVSAGDLIGASPLLSAAFHDEPTIEAMNDIGLDLNAVGNHEFDEGGTELLRMQSGGCHPTDGCKGGHRFAGANFKFLAANVVNKDTGQTLFRPYVIKEFQGINVGFIGLTLKGTPLIVSPAGIKNLEFLDEAATINKYSAELQRKGVQAIVVLIHEGGSPSNTLLPSTVNACIGVDDPLSDPIVNIVNHTTQAVDVFMTGHTHQAYNCVIDGRPVTSAAAQGRLLTDVDLKVDRSSGDITQVAADNRIITRDVDKAPDISALIAHYKAIVAPISDALVGRAAADITRTMDPSGENPLGNLIADAQLADTDGPSEGAAVAAFMNPGGVRADMLAGDVTYGEAFDVQPFSNILTTITLTGRQIYAVLQQQWCEGAQTILLPSATVHYTWDSTKVGTACTTNPASGLTIGGNPVANDDSTSYRITVNNFLADGGDGFTALKDGTNRLGGSDDLAALVKFLEPSKTGTPVAPPATDRIDVTG